MGQDQVLGMRVWKMNIMQYANCLRTVCFIKAAGPKMFNKGRGTENSQTERCFYVSFIICVSMLKSYFSNLTPFSSTP